MMGYNPMLEYQRNQLLAQQAMIQNQLNQMNRNAPQTQFSPYAQQQNNPSFLVRQIGSIDEAKGYPVDPGIMYFFLDTGNGKIYLKQLNANNGKSDFFTYSIQEQVNVESKNEPLEQINLRLTNIEKIIGGMYDKSISSLAGNEKSNEFNTATDASKNANAEPADVSAGSANDKRKK